MNKTRLTRSVVILVLAIILFALPLVLQKQSFLLHLMIMAGVYSILAVSLRLVYIPNVWFVGTAAFYGMGAYAVALLMREVGLSFWLCLPLVGVGVALVALGFGYVTLRVKGIYFAILSIAFVEVVRLIFVNTLGQHRVITTPAPNAIGIPHLFTINFVAKLDYYYLILLLFIVIMLILYRIEKSPIGLNLKAIAQRAALAQSVGIRTVWHEIMAFCIHAVCASIAGAFFATYNQTISPDSFTVGATMIILIMMLVGGMGSIWGPVIGAVFLTIVPELLPVTPFIQRTIYAILVIVILYFLPGGLVSLPRVIRSNRWSSRQSSLKESNS